MGGGHCKPPENHNKTVEALRRDLEQQAKQQREHAEWQRKQDEDCWNRDEADRKRRENDERIRKEEAERLRKRLEEEERKRKEEKAKMDAALKRLEEQEVQAKKREEEARQAKEREEKLRKEMAAQLQKSSEERAAHQRRIDEQAAQTKKRQQEAAEARAREEQLRKEAEERQRRADEDRANFLREMEKQKLESKRREEEAARREEQARKEAEERQRLAEEEHAAFQRELEETNRKLAKGIQPVVLPTQEEYDAAEAKVQYDIERLHFAVCGPSGSGKSSLINSFRGLKKGDGGAADVGIVETTLEVTRYPDPRKEMPYPRFIWFDVPGAGTFNIPAWQYFNQQGLFIFDFIVLVYDNRFTQIDADVLDNCRRFKIPVFIVRSKANMQIRNLADDEQCSTPEARTLFVTTTRKNLQENLEKSGLCKPGDLEPPPRVYIVSRECVLDHTLHLEEQRWEKRNKTIIPKEEKKGGRLTDKYIDEEQLIHDLLETAYDRRYAPSRSRSLRVTSTLLQAAAKLNLG